MELIARDTVVDVAGCHIRPCGEHVAAKALPAIVSVFTVLAGGLIARAFADFGPLSAHMAMHIAAMNVIAPLAAMLLCVSRQSLPFYADPTQPSAESGFSSARRWLWIGTCLQIVLLITWHMPPLHHFLANSADFAIVVGGVLMISSTLFWLAVIIHAEDAPWQAMLALTLNAKVACLLGGLLVFAPRDLYAAAAHHAAASIGDQQLAGLLMLAVCPLSYVVAGITIAAQMMARLDRKAVVPQAGTASR